MTKKEFVTYEQAVKLKELGFCEETTGIYFDCLEDPIFTYGSIYKLWNLKADEILAPTLSQAAKWLREIKNLYVDVYLDFPTTTKSTWAYELKEINRNWFGYNTIGFNSYEAALLAGIDKALEILK